GGGEEMEVVTVGWQRWRVEESGVGDRVDPEVGSVFGLRRKSPPEKFSGGGEWWPAAGELAGEEGWRGRECIKIVRYNSMFAFTSMGGKVDDTVNYGRGPFCYRIHGENYHKVGSLLPGTVNPLVKKFRMAGERIKSSNDQTLKLKLIGTRNQDGRQYNLPTAFEEVALIVGDFDRTKNKSDINLLQQDDDLKRINGYTMIEAERMSFNRKQQKDLRCETYSKLAKLAEDPESGVQLRGKK
ncbi:hypothetical protein Tco_1323246, partial [Tanacetum coccineum]